jgi:EAL domain-containing protein (putative c-di-GMP-specific phosphodiesterase class I)
MSEDTSTVPERRAAPDPAGEIVRLAARLIRLQSRVRVSTAASADSGVADSTAASDIRRRDARQAAIRSGIEVLEGFAVSLIGEIHEAIDREAFHYVYQPIVSTATGAIKGFEALLRWRRGAETVTPALFLPLAEETRSIIRIQQRLLDDIATAYARLPSPTFIAINWSPAQLSDVSAASSLIDRVAELQLDPTRIVVEITERSALSDPDLVHASAMRLKDHGFRLALDDFGSGYCSFTTLSELPIDLLKIDGSLIRSLNRSARARVILDGILEVAHRLGHRVVAEGVELVEQVHTLRELGCDLVQGAFVGEPAREPTTEHKK